MSMTPADRRERERLRSERRRRAAGIQPRKQAEKPWLAMGVSRSTYYRRRAKERALPLFPAVIDSAAIARTVAFYVLTTSDYVTASVDRCDVLIAELSAIIARGQAALDPRAGIGPQVSPALA